MVTAGDVRDLLDDRQELEPAVEAVLAAEEPFTFDDLAIDSGAFGELVAHGIVTKTDGAYRVADREAVRRGLAGEAADDAAADVSDTTRSITAIASLADYELTREDRLTGAALLGGLLLVALFRLVPFPLVFQGGHVVLSSNDPYYYRVIVEALAANPEVTPSSLPGVAAKGEPLMVVTLWLVAAALGGGTTTIGQVLAWYPVVSAVVTGLLVYAVGTHLTDDRRVGLASVLMLAVLPGHAMRTGLGFADHHAFDYPWLALTLLGLTLVAVAASRESLDPTRLGVAATTVAVGVTGQVLAWEAGPLLVIPVGLVLAAEGLRAVAADDSPLRTGGPVVAGLAVAALLTWGLHEWLNWHTTLVAAAPLLLAIAGVGVLVAAEATRRLGLPAWALAAVEVVGLGAGALVLQTAWPEFWARLTSSVADRLIADRAIAEVRSLFSDSLGWLLLFGLLLLVALPYMGWSVHRARREGRWLPLAVYGWYFLVLATIQVRFVGELSPVLAVFAGFAFVHVSAWVYDTPLPAVLGEGDAPRIRLPDWKTTQAVVILFVVLAGFSIVQVPLKTNLLTTPEGQYETAMEMNAYDESRGLEYPANYVLSPWGDNRMYNYFVNGEALSYGYAQSHYEAFLTATDGQAWYERLGSRRGFVVTTDDMRLSDAAVGTRLHAHHGSRSTNASGLGHYRLVASNAGGSYKAFAVVPGAMIRGSAAPNATVTVETEVSVDGETFTYTRRTTTNARGAYSVRVAYPSTYSVDNATVAVNESAVTNGSTVAVDG